MTSDYSTIDDTVGPVKVREHVDVPPVPERSLLALWLGFLLPPAMALLNVVFGFALSHIACETGSKLGVHIFVLVSLVIALIGGLLAWREWNASGEDTPGEIRGAFGSRRLLSFVGLLGFALSAFVILAQWLPVFILDPCMRT